MTYPDSLELIRDAYVALDKWEGRHASFEHHPSLEVDAERLNDAMEEYLSRLTARPRSTGGVGNYPFFHPDYAGQMLKPPHPVALAAYAIAARVNPNNHALDGGPATGQMEKEVVAMLAGMFGWENKHLGHLTGGGTVANVEALFVARELAREEGRPDRIAVSEEAHYTHARMAHVLGVDVETVPTTQKGTIDLTALQEILQSGNIGTLVLTAGTTSLGAVDPIEEAIPLAREAGVRVHVDAAYGGFFTLLADRTELDNFPSGSFKAIREADSVVVDPHKHGLQPYGCGAVLYRDPSVGRFYKHDSPYTYFTTDELHLGEISLECSRPGAAAGALWLTFQVCPLKNNRGLGLILESSLRAARLFRDRLSESTQLQGVLDPQTDIVVYAPTADSMSELDRKSKRLFDQGMEAERPLFLSLLRLSSGRLRRMFSGIEEDAASARVLRSVLMKPEHEVAAESLVQRIEHLIEG